MHPTNHAANMPDKPAYIMAASGAVVTYGQLNDRTNQCAQLFRSLGVQAGDHIAILMENDVRFLEVCWAAQRSGLIFTAISTHLSHEEAAYILDNCDAILLVASQLMAGLASAACARTPRVKHRLMVNGDVAGFVSYESNLLARLLMSALVSTCFIRLAPLDGPKELPSNSTRRTSPPFSRHCAA